MAAAAAIVETPGPEPAWLRALRDSASVPPLRPRVPLWAGQSVIGSVESGFLSKIALQSVLNGRHQLLKEEQPRALGWRLMGDVTVGLNQLARILHDAGLAGAWRDEQLAVHDQFDHLKGTVERAAVRPLGIATVSVHLVGQAPDGRFWVQQRALSKSTDPGLWDTLAGGMVAAADTVVTGLARETWEEAGLQVAELQNQSYGGRLATRRPSTEGHGVGYMVEDIEWYRCTVPQHLLPENRDGEVERFALLDKAALLERLQQGDFTIEAALVLVAAMEQS